MWERLEDLARRYDELSALMARQEVATDYARYQELAKEQSAIADSVTLYRRYQAANAELAGARALVEEADDREMRELGQDEIRRLEPQVEALTQELRFALLPRDPRDEKNVILEIRGAEGGEEAALFASELFRMYSRYAERHGWKSEIISATPSDMGGFKEVAAEIRGQGAYSRLKYESGGHRVQRVPITEAKGRIHTSLATVAVLPEAEEVDLHIDPKEVREDVYHSGGAGGQNVNKVATAIRLTHFPSGIVVACQDERSQLQNRVKAWNLLRAKVLDLEQRKRDQELSDTRRTQVGSGERSEKIRTYNFPQDRLTDHRLPITVHNLPGILDGQIDDLIDAVVHWDQQRQFGDGNAAAD
ncbi:MAG: peptide chain release factor 1 [Dehalococcoidia bacterium]